ncbi:MAG: hypothetical protein DI585_06790 [Pseudomonas fluorescens]|nr:MAG: hypothetical protein DI585_06790 [Pseudomonas fluorescens]
MKKLTRHPLFITVMITVVALYSKLVHATARVQVVTPLPPELLQGPVVLAGWHQQIAMLPAISQHIPHPLLALMSASRDGVAIAAIARWFGIKAAVGSSHRNALTGTRELLRAAKSGHALFITPDGPRGPAYVAKQGASEVARLTKLPLVPCAVWSSKGKTFNSWDKFRLPYPFATLYVAFGNAITDEQPASLQSALNTLTTQAQGGTASLATHASNS